MFAAVAALGSLAAAMTTGAQAVAQETTIAVVGPMTGPYATIGEQMRRGAQMAIDDLNGAGGVAGGKLRLTVEDDACDPMQAVAVANRLVVAGVKFVDGHVCSGSTIPASAVYAENNVLMMTPAASNPALTEDAAKKGWTTIMRLYGRDDAQGRFIGPWIAEKYKGKRVAILHDKSAYGAGLAQEVRRSMNAAGLKEIMFDSITAGEKDSQALVSNRALVSNLKSRNPDAIYYGGYHTEAGLIVRQARGAGLKAQFITDDAIATTEFWSISGPAGEGMMFTFPTDPRANPNAKAFVDRFRAQGFDPEGFTLYSYAVVQAIAEGMNRARGADDPTAVAKALRSSQPIQTALGPVTFDEKGDIREARYEVYVWRDGKYAAMR
jgi:branched-chain amino acid transport system substrate-binding protein